MSDHVTQKSKVSRIPPYTEITALVIFIVSAIFLINGAIEFTADLPDDDGTLFIVWNIQAWTAFKIGSFLIAGLVGWRNRVAFRKNKDKPGFRPKHVNILHFSFRLSDTTLITCVTSVMRMAVAAVAKGMTITYIILMSDRGKLGSRDTWLINKIIPPLLVFGIQVYIEHQEYGKRDGFDKAFLILNTQTLPCPVAETGLLVLDGDSEIPREFTSEFLVRIFAPLSLIRKVVATTIHNLAFVHSDSIGKIAEVLMRFIRRFWAMSASPNVLTGRCSAYHGTIAANPEFQRLLISDLINHQKEEKGILEGDPLLAPGRLIVRIFGLAALVSQQIFFTLTGDDKSTIWFVLKEGYDIVFNPDLYVVCHEDIPHKIEWLPDIWCFQLPALAIRYCRNTMNNHARLLSLGIKRLTIPRYVSIMIDRFTFWTAILGLMGVPYLTWRFGFGYLYVYFSWVLTHRTFMTLIMCIAAAQAWSAFYPVIMYNYHTSLVLVKIWATVDAVSNWTRQRMEVVRTNRLSNILAFVIIVVFMFLVVGIMSEVVRIPDLFEFSVIFQ